MLAAATTLTISPTANPPIVLVHGSANSASVWTLWQQELAKCGWASHAIDLRGHGKSAPVDLSGTTMEDYASDVTQLVARLKDRPVVIGWSMGGLVALMVASSGAVAACVCLEPSAPALNLDESRPLRNGVFDPVEYGITSTDPKSQPAMWDLDLEERKMALASLGPESRMARDQRKRGIVIESLQCPLMLVDGWGGSKKLIEPF